MKNVNTKRKTESDIKIFKDWHYQQWENTVIQSILESKICTCTWKDFFSAHMKFKQDYEPDSLKCIQASISRYLSDGECWYLRHRIFISNNSVQSKVTNNNSIKQTVIDLAPILPNSNTQISREMWQYFFMAQMIRIGSLIYLSYV